jgi:hypothetical protein
VEEEGFPPVNVHKYVGVESPQFVTTSVGLIIAGAQEFKIPFRETDGRCLTVTTLEVVKVPHGLVTESVIVYVPAPLKLKEGFTEVASVPPENDQLDKVPQNPDE